LVVFLAGCTTVAGIPNPEEYTGEVVTKVLAKRKGGICGGCCKIKRGTGKTSGGTKLTDSAN
jgi:hypothetical protein